MMLGFRIFSGPYRPVIDTDASLLLLPRLARTRLSRQAK